MRTIDYTEALTLAKAEIAKEGEDFVYSNYDSMGDQYCVYVADGKPSCLVGRILINNGIIHRAVLGRSIYNDERFGALRLVLADAGVEFTAKARSFLSELQGLQDMGETWGEALRRAEVYVSDILGN